MLRPACIITYSHVRVGLFTYSPAYYSIEVAVEEAMFEVETSDVVFMDYDRPLAALDELGE